MGVKTLLGLTATAPKSTLADIARNLGVDPDSGIINPSSVIPDNLILSVSKDQDRDTALLKLLDSPTFKDLNSIIVYCTRRDECTRLTQLVRTYLGNSKGIKKEDKVCEEYHAGLSAYKRRSVQKAFMNGKLRIVVATVAFGMGIDKADIRSVIHFNMPKTFESYIQVTDYQKLYMKII